MKVVEQRHGSDVYISVDASPKVDAVTELSSM